MLYNVSRMVRLDTSRKLSSTSFYWYPRPFLHTAEAVHGDLGRVTIEDTVIILSNSGSTDEMKKFYLF